MESIRQVIYISQATLPLAKRELEELVATASCNNKRMGVTGALLYIETSFIQVLEGAEETIASLLATIESDPRHKNMRILSDRLVDFRNFEEWSMGYVKPDIQDSSIVISELRSRVDLERDDPATDMPLPNTFAMMQQLYRTDLALQRARSPV